MERRHNHKKALKLDKFNQLILGFVIGLISVNLLVSQTKIVDALHIEDDEFYYLFHIDNTSSKFNNQRKLVRSSFPKDAISLGWDEGYYITDLSYGNGYWSLIMTKKTSNQTRQTWSTVSTTDELHKKVKKY